MIALLLIVGSTFQAPEPPPPAAKPAAGAAAKEGPRAEDGEAAEAKKALRRLLLAMITKEEAAIREVALNDEELDWLIKGPTPPADQMDRIKKSMEEVPLRALKAGEEVDLGKAGKITIKPDDVSADRAMIALPAGPPLRVQKVDGRWRVDARPIIAARKGAAAAAAARKKAG